MPLFIYESLQIHFRGAYFLCPTLAMGLPFSLIFMGVPMGDMMGFVLMGTTADVAVSMLAVVAEFAARGETVLALTIVIVGIGAATVEAEVTAVSEVPTII